MDFAKGWKTLLFAALVALAGVAQTFDWATVVPPQYVGYAMIGISAVIALLRYITTTPVGQK